MEKEARVAVVTGASSGVGAACARRFASEGWNVVINYRGNRAGARSVEEDCVSFGTEALVVRADVSDDDACRGLVAAADERWGRLDALVNNAGTTKFCAQDDLNGLAKEDFLAIYSVNVVGPYQMTRAAVPLMRRGGGANGQGSAGGGGDGGVRGAGGMGTMGGSIVNVASMAGITGVGSSTAYAASKGALITLTLSLARALGPDIQVNAVCPGFIQGEWLRKGLGDETYERVRKGREGAAALRMTVTPEIVADGIFYFATGAAGVTGETLMVDGGHHLSGASVSGR